MPYSFLTKAKAASADTMTVTTPSFDSTGADFLVAMVGLYTGGGIADATDGDVADNKGNTWHFLDLRETASNTEVAIFWTQPTTVGAGHTVSFTRGQAVFPAIDVAAFAGSAVASPLDQNDGNAGGSGDDISAGSVTPSENNTLVITGVATGGAVTIDGVAAADGFTLIDTVDFAGGVNIGVGLAYKLLPVAAPQGATWELSGSTDRCALIASFLSAAVGGQSTPVASRFLRGTRSHRRRRAA